MSILPINTAPLLMRRALELAAFGGPHVRPNPLVGCVITDATGTVLAEGWHQRYGGPHAEVNAVAALQSRAAAPADARQLLRGRRVFVTLEPCAHHGQTPPCVDLLLRYGATDVIVATADPNPLVGGRGLEQLRAAGCHVTLGLLAEEARWLNRRFFTAQQHNRPWVVLKWAQSADGFLAGPDGAATPITGEAARRLVHRWRTEEAAILVGTTTARLDNPRLNTRHWPGPAPTRVVLTGQRALPPELHLLTDKGAPLLTYDGGNLSLAQILRDLRARNLTSVLVEGGAAVLNAFLAADLWDEIRVLTNPALLLGGGVAAPVLPSPVRRLRQTRVGGDDVREYARLTSPAVPR